MIFRTTVAATSVLLSIATTALATQQNVLLAAGAWTALCDQSNATDGQPMCLMRTTPTIPKSGFMVKYVRGKGVWVHVTKTGWTVPNGAAVAAILTLNTTPWTAVAHRVASMGVTARTGLYWLIKPDEVAAFVDAFRTANSAVLRFPQGSEPAWSLNTNGAREAAEAFAQCMARLGGNETGKEVSEAQPYAQPPSDTSPRPMQTVPINKPNGDGI
jgi:hypothetical protein